MCRVSEKAGLLSSVRLGVTIHIYNTAVSDFP